MHGLYPQPEMSAAEFESFVADQLATLMRADGVLGLVVDKHPLVAGVDGSYDFDATLRYRLGGIEFLVVVEAKYHSRPIERELVQVLRDKVASVGGHKGVMVARSGYQSGALDYASVHGIALISVTEGRFTIERRSAEHLSVVSRDYARALGVHDFVAHSLSQQPDGAVHVSLIDPEYDRSVEDAYLYRPPGGSDA